MNKDRLLAVARALRESPAPEKFTMEEYGYGCNTPACAFGHYAARADLQGAFALDKDGWPILVNGPAVYYPSPVVLRHFGITGDEAAELFAGPEFDDDGEAVRDGGCGGAKTARAAAEYIEEFVRRHS